MVYFLFLFFNLLLLGRHISSHEIDYVGKPVDFYIDRAVNNNLELKKLKSELDNKKLDLKKKFRYLKESKFKDIKKKVNYTELENLLKDKLFSIKSSVRNNYYNIIILRRLVMASKKNLFHENEYIKSQKKNFLDGKISKSQFQNLNKKYIEKKMNYSSHLMNYTNAKRAFLFELNFNIDYPISVEHSIELIKDQFNFEKDRIRLIKVNRNIRMLKIVFDLKNIFYNLLNKKIESKDSIQKAKKELNQAKFLLNIMIRNQERLLLATHLNIRRLRLDFLTKKQEQEYYYLLYMEAIKKYDEGKISKYQKSQQEYIKELSEVNYLKSIAKLNIEKYNYINFF